MKRVICIFCLVFVLPWLQGGGVGVVHAVSQTDLFYTQNASNGTIYRIPQTGGYSTPFGNVTNNCLPIGLIPAAKLGGIVVGCWNIHSLQMVPMPQGGRASNYTQLPSTCNPEQDMLAPDGNIYVACDVSSDFVKVSTTAPYTVSTIANLGTADNCQRPQGVITDPSDPSRFIVSCFSTDKLVAVSGTAVSDYAAMPSGCGPIGMTFIQSGDLFTVCNTGGQVQRNTFAGGSPQQATKYANLPMGCSGWGVAQLTAGQYQGDLVVSCRASIIYRLPITAQIPASTTGFSTDFPFPLPQFVTPIIDTDAPTFSAGSTISAFSIGTTNLTLVWSTAQDDVAVTGYRLYQGTTILANLSSDARVFSVGGLQPGTTYTFTIQAGDAAGNWIANGLSITITTATQPNPILPYVPWIAVVLGAAGLVISILLVLRRPRSQKT